MSKDKIRKEILKIIDTNQMEIQHTIIYGMQQN